ncbi:hypothetical protein [Borreliella japonica]|nr:hypothetical protein [Borreliella japonica]WKC87628.1 hypothetical protein QIA21_00185 [Borreliella japonica]
MKRNVLSIYTLILINVLSCHMNNPNELVNKEIKKFLEKRRIQNL